MDRGILKEESFRKMVDSLKNIPFINYKSTWACNDSSDVENCIKHKG